MLCKCGNPTCYSSDTPIKYVIYYPPSKWYWTGDVKNRAWHDDKSKALRFNSADEARGTHSAWDPNVVFITE